MTIYICLYILIVTISSSMFIWGLLKKDRVFQYPTIAGVSWLVFFGIQAFASVVNVDKYPAAVLEDGGLVIALVMVFLCAAAGWLGYYRAGKCQRSWTFSEFSVEKIFWGGIVLYGIGFFSAYKLGQLGGGFVQQFTGGGHYGLEWAGAPVKYAFFSKLIYPGLALVLMSTMRAFSFGKLLVCILMMLYPAAVIFFLGRRTEVVLLSGIILLALFFVRRIRIPRLVTVLGVVATFLVVYYAPAYRNVSQHGLDYAEIRDSISRYDVVRQMMAGEEYCEFDINVFWGAAVNRNLAFGFGIGIYNNLVSMYIPRQIVGEGFKRSLIAHDLSKEAQEVANRLYWWQPQYGCFLTGPYTAFSQFWFFGCLLYYVFGYTFRLLWEAAYEKNSLSAQIWYMSCFVLIPLSITSSIVSIPARLLYIFAFMWFVSRLCSVRTPEHRLQDVGFNPVNTTGLPLVEPNFVRNR